MNQPLAVSQGLALLILFVILPFVVAGGVIAFVSWRADGGPPPVRTSDILATGLPATAEVLAVRPMGGFLDGRPMVKMRLRVLLDSSTPFEMEVVQSIPRALLRGVAVGDVVDVRVTADHVNGAVVISP